MEYSHADLKRMSYFTFGSVYMSMLLSHFVPAYPSPSPCPQVHSLHLCVYSCPVFIHSSVDGHLGCFHVLAIVNSAAVNTAVHDSF